MNFRKILIYMPALNEEETILKVLKSIPKKYEGFDELELLVVNDGSSDDTEKEAIKAGATVLNHNHNQGVGKAFQTAVDYALKSHADIMVSVDADGQFDVNQITDMIAPILNKKADFCSGNRFANGRPVNMPKVKFFGNSLISKIVGFVSKAKIQDVSCGFRAYSRDCLYNLNLQGSFTYTHETILDLLHKGYKISQIPVNVKYFDGRVSRVANNLFVYGFQTSFIIFKSFKDYRPLSFFLTIALIVFIIAVLLAGFVCIHWYNTSMITPYKSLGFIALALFGLSMLISVLAFLADMLNRIRGNQEKILFLTKKKYFEED
ncbi:DPM/DPG synthase family glycosyltransferase [Algibacter pectinivorans]|nr:glycosyltransferase family 2 protein [Algibacter pectinivorans]